ncbi:MAG: hypothetical protein AAF993_02985 [Pseudomonadota bacterium]
MNDLFAFISDPDRLPVIWANYVSIGAFVVLAILVWLIPRRLIFADAKDQAAWRDIRWWATALIALQLTIYATFN